MADEKIYQPTDGPTTLDKPTFDFSNVSYKRGRESGRLQARIQHLGKKIEAAGADDDIDSLLAEWDALLDQQEEYICEAITHVPQSWLIKDAPATTGINWQDARSLGWLRADKPQALGAAKNEAQNRPN